MQELIIKTLQNRFREKRRKSKTSDCKVAVVRRLDSDHNIAAKKSKLSPADNKLEV